MYNFRYEPWPELKWLLDSFLPRFSAAAASVSMEQDEEEVAECDKVRKNIFILKRGGNQSRLDDFFSFVRLLWASIEGRKISFLFPK